MEIIWDLSVEIVQEHDLVVERGVVRLAGHLLHPRLRAELQHDPGDNQENPPALQSTDCTVTTSPPEAAPWGDTIRNHFLSFQNFVFTTQQT